MTVQTVFAELSFDMQAWASEEHFTSWLGLSPAPNISGGKVIGHQPRRVRNRVATALRMAAASRLRNQSYLEPVLFAHSTIIYRDNKPITEQCWQHAVAGLWEKVLL